MADSGSNQRKLVVAGARSGHSPTEHVGSSVSNAQHNHRLMSMNIVCRSCNVSANDAPSEAKEWWSCASKAKEQRSTLADAEEKRLKLDSRAKMMEFRLVSPPLREPACLHDLRT
ncbi:hypothetical protein E2542_SST09349 [Spatholobus suberectus]|nr:hypothetical protein E2542_SST09349 [Spatholobus suberectus]